MRSRFDRSRRWIAAATAIAAMSTMGSAASLGQGLLSEKQMSVALAQEAAWAAVEQCRKDGYRVAAAVADRAGNMKALLRDDGAGPHTLDTSTAKAYTSATLRSGTLDTVKRLEANPASAGLRQVPGILVLGGGLPIRAGDQVVGAIGVGGAPGGDKDEVCAQAGIDKIKDRLN